MRTATTLSNWLQPAFGPTLELRPDLDQLEALSPERDASCRRRARLNAVTPRKDDVSHDRRKTRPHRLRPAPGRDQVKRDNLADKANFNPGQLRDDHGQWAGGGDDVQLITDRKRPVDLLDEESRGGHTISKHVGKSEAFLLNRVLTEVYRIGPVFSVGLERAGSFPSLEAANKLVNSTLSENSAIVDMVAKGQLGATPIEKDFGSLTGCEAYRRNDRSQPYMRDTTAVRVVIEPDTSSSLGFRVITAFPISRKN